MVFLGVLFLGFVSFEICLFILSTMESMLFLIFLFKTFSSAFLTSDNSFGSKSEDGFCCLKSRQISIVEKSLLSICPAVLLLFIKRRVVPIGSAVGRFCSVLIRTRFVEVASGFWVLLLLLLGLTESEIGC